MDPQELKISLSYRSEYISDRASVIERETGKMAMWDVLSNLWEPKDNPDGIVNLGMAQNWLLRDSISQRIRDSFDPPSSALTYTEGTTGSKRLKDAMSKFINHHFFPFKQVLPEHVSVTNGTTSALEHVSWALADPGEYFIVGQPYYMNFVPNLTWRFGARLLTVPFETDDDRFSEVAVERYQQALDNAKAEGKKVAGIILCHPHNPLGRCYPRKVLIGMMKVAQEHRVHLISDEVYALSTWENTVDKERTPDAFHSLLSIDPKGKIDGHRVHVVWGMSKDFAAKGLRVGVLISQYNNHLHSSLVEAGIFTMISSFSDHIAVNLLEDEEWLQWYLPEHQRRLSQNYAKVARWAQNHGINYAKGANAGLFMFADLGTKYRETHDVSSIHNITQLVQCALKEHKVYVSSGDDFGCEKPGWFRIVFCVPDYCLFEGLGRIIEALH
ncbi:unnamed protein product [Clonostachys chloroleuca]|uniref:Aminotransferase class I/classII large domain-containing protein n=1 Tax=Clonostachys chloroleuca TaxID=1926264 RepID=A0AA35ME28_9HYPO|nr:unnamed protein product [Clonostachys chloroleuca]